MSDPPRTSTNSAVGFLALVVVIGLVATAFASLGTAIAPGSSGGDAHAAPADVREIPSAAFSTSGPSSTIAQGQSSAVTETIPSSGTAPYSWQWLYSTNQGASYSTATTSQCAAPSGTGATPGTVATCAFATTDTTPTGTYLFELRVTDSASVPESVTSLASSTITVNPAPPAGHGTGPPALDTEPASLCNSGCTASDWFGGAHGSGALAITTAGANELLVLEITDAGESGSGLSAADVSDSQASSWALLSPHAWNGTGSEQYLYYALDPVAGLDTVTLDSAAGSHTTASSATAVLAAFTGVDTSAPIGTVGSFAASIGTAASAAVVASVAPTTILGVLSTNQTAASLAPTASPAFSVAGNISDGVATQSYLEYYGTLSTGTYTSSPTWTGTAAWGEEAVVVQGASPLSVTVAPTSAVADLAQTVPITATAVGGTGTVQFAWSMVSGSCPGFTNSGTATLGYLASSTTSGCVLTVTATDADGDSAQPTTPSSVVVNLALTNPGTPAPSASALDFNQGLTVTGTIPSTGTPLYSWQWLVSINGGSFTTIAHCLTGGGAGASPGATETCTIPSNTLIAGYNYAYALRVTDSASTPETATSLPSSPVVVSSTLTAPAAPAVSAKALDRDQTLTVTGTVPVTGSPTYTWLWQVSVNGGAYGTANQCVQSGGSGATGGTVESCSITGGSLTAGSNYIFKLKVTDSATAAESMTSVVSATVDVSSTLLAPPAPTVSATSLSAATPLTVTGTIPATGTANFDWQWLVSVSGGGYVDSTYCAVNSGVGAHASATETCAIPANTLTASTSYNFVLQVTDSATNPEVQPSPASPTVTTTGALTGGTPTPTSPILDNGQSTTLMANPSGGTQPYSFQWYSGTTAALCTGLGNPIAGAISSSYFVNTPASSLYYCVKVTDAVSVSSVSAADEVTVNSALIAPGPPNVSVTVLDANQALTVTDTLPTTGTPQYAYEWLYSTTGGSYAKATMCATPSGTGGSGAGVTCTIAVNVLTAAKNYTFELSVNDSATTPVPAVSLPSSTVWVSSALATLLAPTVSATKLDWNQALTASATIPTTGTPSYSWQWLVQVNGAGGYLASTLCSINSGTGANGGTVVTCSAAADSLTIGDTYAFKLQVWDGATTPETLTSAASPLVTVRSFLTTPASPTVSAPALDVNQVLAVSGTIPLAGSSPYSWLWLVSVGGGSYGPTTQCAVNSGVGALAGAGETCSIAGGRLVAGDTYAFEFQVSDGATSAETLASLPSANVTVSSALTAPLPPSLSALKLDVDQSLNVTATIPSTGTGDYAWQWLVSVNSGVYGPATQCAVNSGLNADAGDIEACAIAGGGLVSAQTYSFKLQVTDNATNPEVVLSPSSLIVSVASTLTPPGVPTVSATTLDADQSLTVSGTLPSNGTSPYSWQWLIAVNGVAYANATQCAVANGTGGHAGTPETCTVAANTLAAGDTYTFELEVADGATAPEAETSSATSLVTVNSALSAPSAPAVSATALDADQSLAVTGVIPSGGTPLDSWQWLVSVNGGAFSLATQCSVDEGSGASAGATETCRVVAGVLTPEDSYSFEFGVSDSAPTSDVTVSAASPAVLVSSALGAPGAPSVSATALDEDQSLTVVGTIPITGSPPYAWQWEVSVDGGAFADATQCGQNRGTGASPGAQLTCSVNAGTLSSGSSYAFALEVSDGATSSQTLLSPASSTVTVQSSLSVPAAPTVSAGLLDADQALTVTGVIPSTGTGPYSWLWLMSADGGPYAAALVCSVISGSGVGAGSVESCSVAANVLLGGDSYRFELRVTDSSGSVGESATSAGSTAVAVYSPLTAPTAPTPSTLSIALTQALNVTGNVPSSGAPTYAWQWLVSVNGSHFAAASICSVGSGTGASAGATEACTIAAGRLVGGASYAFELEISDSAETAESVISAASPSVTALMPAILVPPAQGPIGAKFTVAGTAFSALGAVTVSFNGVPETPTSCSVGNFSGTTITADASGIFVCTLTVPSVFAGAYSVVAEDLATSVRTAVEMFRVTTPSILLSPVQGASGTLIDLTGSGFSVSSPVASVVFDSQPITQCTNGSLTTNAAGDLFCTFVVPSGTSGTTVTVTDAGGQSTSGTFLVTGGTTTSSSSSGFPWFWVAVGVSAVAAVLLVFVLVQRRRRAPASSSPPPEEPPAAASPSAPSVTPSVPAPSPRPATPPATPPRPVAPVGPPARPITAAPRSPVTDPLAAALAAVPVKSDYLPLDRAASRTSTGRVASASSPYATSRVAGAPTPSSTTTPSPSVSPQPPPTRVTRPVVELIPARWIEPSPTAPPTRPAPLARPPTAPVTPPVARPPPAASLAPPAPVASKPTESGPTAPPLSPGTASPAPTAPKPPATEKQDFDVVLSDIDSLIHQILRPPPKKPAETTSGTATDESAGSHSASSSGGSGSESSDGR